MLGPPTTVTALPRGVHSKDSHCILKYTVHKVRSVKHWRGKYNLTNGSVIKMIYFISLRSRRHMYHILPNPQPTLIITGCTSTSHPHCPDSPMRCNMLTPFHNYYVSWALPDENVAVIIHPLHTCGMSINASCKKNA